MNYGFEIGKLSGREREEKNLKFSLYVCAHQMIGLCNQAHSCSEFFFSRSLWYRPVRYNLLIASPNMTYDRRIKVWRIPLIWHIAHTIFIIGSRIAMTSGIDFVSQFTIHFFFFCFSFCLQTVIIWKNTEWTKKKTVSCSFGTFFSSSSLNLCAFVGFFFASSILSSFHNY